MSRILLTGAGGMVGSELRKSLNGWKDILRVSDIADLGDAKRGEEVVHCNLADKDAVIKLVEGCDSIIHLGGQSVEHSFDTILNSNIKGVYNIYEAARLQGIKRILFASSNHVTGFHNTETLLDAKSEFRPDSMYGVSKGFGELLARYYWDKFGIETAVVRIGYCFPNPTNKRTMAIWLSFNDFTSLVKQIFKTPRVGFTVIYGMSNNKQKWWDNHLSSYIGWQPEDSSEEFANNPEIVNDAPDPFHPDTTHQGGFWVSSGAWEDEN